MTINAALSINTNNALNNKDTMQKNRVSLTDGASRMYMPFDAAGIAMQVGWCPLVRGYFGRAKTALFNDIASSTGRKVFCLVGSMTDPLDLKGLPFITDGEVRYAPEAMFKYAMEHNGNVVIFLDELTTFPGAVKATALKMIHERIVGPHTLPSETRFVAACNAAIDAPNGRPLDAGNINRMVVIDMPPLNRDDVSRWNRMNVDGFASVPPPAWTAVPANWRDSRPEVAKYIEAWADVGDNWKAWDDRAKNNEKGDFMPYGSMRSWDMATDVMAAARAAGLSYDDEQMVFLVEGCIGPASGKSLLSEMRVLIRVPSAEQMISGERPLPTGMFETRLAATRLYDYAVKHTDQNSARLVTALTIRAAEQSGAGVCRRPLGSLFDLLTKRKLTKETYYEELATVIASNRIRLGVE
jgi:MoxR-like ATPase